MHKTYLHTVRRRSVRFLKWSRKKYAAFCSLHCQVTIGQVGKGIADAALSKSKQAVDTGCTVGSGRSVAAPEEEGEWPFSDVPEGLEWLNEQVTGRERVSFSVCACKVSEQFDCFLSIACPVWDRQRKAFVLCMNRFLREWIQKKYKCLFFFNPERK